MVHSYSLLGPPGPATPDQRNPGTYLLKIDRRE